MTDNKVIVKEPSTKLVISTPGPQGPGGRTILNGNGAPSNNLGLTGDFYYNVATTDFYGPKLTDGSWSGATIITLVQVASDFAAAISWELAQVEYDNVFQTYFVILEHNLEFYPNVLVKTTAGDYLETEVDYIDINRIKLGMAQPFSGTAYLS